MVVLIHGAPWSINDWKWMLEMTSADDVFRYVVMDRVWYWRSEQWRSVIDISTQAESIMSLIVDLESKSDVKPLVMGHSYGATIVTKMLMEYSEKFLWGIIVSWAVDPDHEIIFGISYWVQYSGIKHLMGPMLWVANDEKLSHVEQLEKNLQNRSWITVPVHIIHGDKDSLVPYENAEHMIENIKQELVTVKTIPGADHPLQYSHAGILSEELSMFHLAISK